MIRKVPILLPLFGLTMILLFIFIFVIQFIGYTFFSYDFIGEEYSEWVAYALAVVALFISQNYFRRKYKR